MEATASQPSARRQLLLHQLWIAGAAIGLFFTGLGAARLWDEDETDYSRIAREMMLRHDWVVPSWNYRMWGEKPALYYWLVAGSFEAFGVNEFAARLPSALLALATALMTYHLGRKLFRPQVGLWAAFVLMTSLMFDVIARAATHDMTLIFFTTMSLLAYTVVLRRRGSVPGVCHWQAKCANGGERIAASNVASVEASARRDDYASLLPATRWEWFAVYAPMALATLVKGPIGAILPACGMGLFLILSQPGPIALPDSKSSKNTAKTRGQRMRHWAGVAWRWLVHYALKIPAAGWAMRPFLLAGIVLAIAGPWYVWVAIATGGEWPLTFFWRHNLVQFANTIQGHHGPFYYYAPAIFLGFFPWSPLLIGGATTMVRRVRSGASGGLACRLALAWSAVWIVLFSFCATKLPHYVAPTYPLLAIITGLWLADWIAARGLSSFSESAVKKGTVPLAPPVAFSSPIWIDAVWASLALAGIAISALLIWVAPRWLPGQPTFPWLGAILVVGAAAGWLLHRSQHLAASAGTLALTSAVFLTCVLTIAAAPISRQQSGYVAANVIRDAKLSPTKIGMFRWAPQGFVYYCDWPDYIEYFPYAQGALRFLQTTENPVLLVDAEGMRMIEPLLPPDIEVIDRRPRFLKPGEVIVLARRPAASTASAAAPVRQ